MPPTACVEESSVTWKSFRLKAEMLHFSGQFVHFDGQIVRIMWREMTKKKEKEKNIPC